MAYGPQAIAQRVFQHDFEVPAGAEIVVRSDGDASRFLAQATFGPTREAIRRLRAAGTLQRWLAQQFAVQASLQLPYVRDRYLREGQAGGVGLGQLEMGLDISSETGARHDAWWHNAINGEDQLRQRMALALSEIFVVSDRGLLLQASQFGMADYFDTLVRHAFGNFRDLLQAITLHPVMGKYLSAIRNERTDEARDVRPDENFARELLQLFTLGVYQLNPDGTPVLDSAGNLASSYSQQDIVAFAKVFTGWNYANIGWNEWGGNGNTVLPMVAVAAYHEPGSKRLLGGASTSGSAEQDLAAALDNVFNHPNVGPFIGRQLIRRLVTSNPTPQYVERVARVFADNGEGRRGDLAALVSAILLDREAREGPALFPETFGKLREPLLRISHLWRAFAARKTPGAEYGAVADLSYKTPSAGGLYRLEESTEQAVLRAPSVFNFFLPDYSPPGLAGLVAPEFQLTGEATLAITSNMLNSHLEFSAVSEWTSLDLDYEIDLVERGGDLLGHLDTLLFGDAMSAPLRELLADYLSSGSFSSGRAGVQEQIQDSIMLLINSPDYLIQQ